jgi:hypothetical protein
MWAYNIAVHYEANHPDLAVTELITSAIALLSGQRGSDDQASANITAVKEITARTTFDSHPLARLITNRIAVEHYDVVDYITDNEAKGKKPNESVLATTATTFVAGALQRANAVAGAAVAGADADADRGSAMGTAAGGACVFPHSTHPPGARLVHPNLAPSARGDIVPRSTAAGATTEGDGTARDDGRDDGAAARDEGTAASRDADGVAMDDVADGNAAAGDGGDGDGGVSHGDSEQQGAAKRPRRGTTREPGRYADFV